MMNKKLLATLIAATFAAPVAVYAEEDDGPTLYGRLHLGIQHTDTDADSNLDVSTHSSRFGMKGDTDLGNGLNVFYQYEFGVDADTANIISNNRVARVGFDGGFGKVSLGRQWSAMFNHVGTFMDITQAIGTSGTSYRLSNDLQYSVSAGPINIQADLILDGGNKASDGLDMFQIAGSGNFGPFSIGLGLQQTEGSAAVAATAEDDAVPAGPDSDQIGIGAGVNFGNFFIKGGYVNTETDGDTKDNSTTVLNIGGSSDNGLSGFVSFGEQGEDGAENDFVIGQVRKDIGGGTQVYVEARSDDTPDRTRLLLAMRKDF